MRTLFVIVFWLSFSCAFSQNIFKARLLDSRTNEPLIGATGSVLGTTIGASADIQGMLYVSGIPDGKQIIIFSCIGYEARKDTFSFPMINSEPVVIVLNVTGEELEEVVVTSTRSSRTIDDIPTRVEVISGEELEEKATMKPGDIRMQLSESTGIKVQQTSAVSANSNIRIQGLDGRYTQLLKDGFPVYSGFSSGLGIMQIPPLDLRQVEIIKGSASTLYGGGAIAGIVNLISKDPLPERDLSFMLNATSAKGLDLSGFYGQRFKKSGLTLFAASNTQTAYDANGDEFSDLPQIRRLTLNPRLYFYFNDSATLSVGINSSLENRIGGDMSTIQGKQDTNHVYTEENKSARISSQLQFSKIFRDGGEFRFKNSISYFQRGIFIPGYSFEGAQTASFSETDYIVKKSNTDWIAGLNLWTDRFKENQTLVTGSREYNYSTYGAFIQNNWNPGRKIGLETGLRADYQNEYGWFILPRISALYKLTNRLSSRIGGGLGYKTPSVFTQEAEQVTFRNVLPIDINTTRAETSVGGNWDVNYKTILFESLSFSINQMFFYTQLDKALILNRDSLGKGIYMFENAQGHVDTRGFETNIKLTYNSCKLFVGYTLIDTKRHYDNINSQIPLTPKHRAGLVLMYEKEGKFRIGYEAYYTGKQYLSNGVATQDYWTMGLMGEKKWEHFSLYINFENFLDLRQSRFGSLYSGSPKNPQFAEIYAPTEGFVMNAGIKLRL